MTDLLHQAHTDGSPVYVATPAGRAVAAPALGDRVVVRVEVPHAAEVDAVHVRTTPDTEPAWAPARRVARGPAVDLFEAEVEVVNPISRYRFLLDGPGGQRWLTQLGVVDHDVADTWDLGLVATPPPPAWVADAVLYQVFPDRFARGDGSTDAPEASRLPADALPAAWDDPVATVHPASMRQFYAGDLPGIVRHLDHLVDLGVTGVYLNPVFPAPENHRYCAADFDRVDPLLGGDAALVELAAALHARGMHLIGDLTLNHSGDRHPWFTTATADPSSTEAGFYLWHDHPGGRALGWAGVPTLPKFDHRSQALRAQLYDGPGSVAARWLAPPFSLDGWRVDAANVAGRSGAIDLTAEVQATLLRTMREVRGEDAYLLAEHCHDATADLQGAGWHGTMDYLGFTRAAWSWLRDPDRLDDAMGQPVALPRRGGAAVVRGLDLVRGQVPWRSVVHSLSLLGSHDRARWATVAGDVDRRDVGLAWLLTFPGVPSLYYGDEIGSTGHDDLQARAPMPWHRPERWDHDALAWVRRLVALRRSSVALRRGGLRWILTADDQLAYLRQHPDERVLVQLTRSGTDPVELDARLLHLAEDATVEALLDHPPLRVCSGRLRLPATDRPIARAWRLPPLPVPYATEARP
ncbi:alpha-amylase family glycosyl hydrolase [Egicoccus halophilus]|uniref:Alpha-glycosidase n=1 Tax=Egicoccus halophilus TaxID=1670830 RepID=A0A8J3A7V9_9ACTN|nr:alpha-amylase family glycosyl hydrolase [Egicoccus halophilus]GGI03791.1 alpha-glycosidase [Egicoccus halophilus]